MRTTSAEHISLLQKNPKNIRNICILAHVDHGKTTLADALVASNGIISSRLAGKLRYMDSREDEQIRGITMKSSAISLHYTKENEEFLINLIDSPGHVDFSSEVSTAVRLCDGALVVVDVVEGVSPQTQVVLRQAWLENIRPCLVLNKIDRLIAELKYSTLEAYFHIQRILEQVNAITGKLFSSHVMEKSSTKVENAKNAIHADQNTIDDDTAVSIEQWSSGLEEEDDSSLYFSPDQGNVVFASAIDGWGFSINDFVAIYSKKLGLNAEILRKTLWGDFYLDPKTKRIFKKAQSKGKKPLFVQFVLQNIWAIYEAAMRRDNIKTDQIVKSLNLKVSARDSRSTDPRVHIRSILGQWLPLSSTLLSMIVNKLPSPLQMVGERVEKLMCSGLRTFESLPQETKNLKQDFLACSSDDNAPVIVFVSKMFPVDDRALPKHRRRPLTQEEIALRREIARQKHAEMLSNQANRAATNDDPTTKTSSLEADQNPSDENQESSLPKTHFMAFARVYSGTIRKGKSLYVLGPKHDPSSIAEEDVRPLDDNDVTDGSGTTNPDFKDEGLSVAKSVDRGTNQHVAVCTVDDLYLLMGRELEALDSVPAGNVLGIGRLQNQILKSATIASTVMCPSFTALHIEARPIVRVAVEPVHYADMLALARGMRLLNQADPCVETVVQNTGEHVIIAAGEVHLERCIADLKERFACVPFNVSAPIIPFRETVVLPPKVDMVKEAITGDMPSQPAKQFLSEASSDTNKDDPNKDKTLVEIKTANKQCSIHIRAIPLPEKVTCFLETKTEVIKLLTSSYNSTNQEKRKVATQMSNNKSREETETFEFYDKLKELFDEAGGEWKDAVDNIWAFGPRRTGPNILLNRIPDYKRPSVWEEANKINDGRYRNYDNSILSGFQLATLAGPLCEEPLMGVCFVIENILIDQQPQSGGLWNENTCTTGQTGLDHNNTSLNIENERFEEKDFVLPLHLGKDVEPLCGIEKLKKTIEDSQEDTSKFVNDEGQNDRNSTEETTTSGVQTLNSQDHDGDVGRSEKEKMTKTEEDKGSTSNICSNQGSNFDRFGPMSGQIMSAVKEGCRRAFQLQPMRLMAAMYTCHIQATAEVLGRMYAVIGKREGRVLSEEMMEGSDVFDVEAVLPVAESFGFSEEIRKRTSGLANPQLVFSHWEVVDIDPFWVPTTEEEYMHFGAKADSENQARKYMNSVRRRKGLYVEEKTVEHAEKQRTLKK